MDLDIGGLTLEAIGREGKAQRDSQYFVLLNLAWFTLGSYTLDCPY
jgi:hypothetical protein